MGVVKDLSMAVNCRTQKGSKLNQIPDGIYLIDEEGAFISEEDNTEILLIEETEA